MKVGWKCFFLEYFRSLFKRGSESQCPSGFPDISVNFDRFLCKSSRCFHISIIQELVLINNLKHSARGSCVELILFLHQNNCRLTKVNSLPGLETWRTKKKWMQEFNLQGKSYMKVLWIFPLEKYVYAFQLGDFNSIQFIFFFLCIYFCSILWVYCFE